MGGRISTTARDPSDGAWRFAGYRLAFRSIHDIGVTGVKVSHSTCVLKGVRDFVELHGPTAQADAAALAAAGPPAVEEGATTDPEEDESEHQ